MKYEYKFPEKNPFRANEVTDLKFKIEAQEDWMQKLFVDFDSARSQSFISTFNFALGIEKDRLTNRPNGYEKLIFSGHMGCGKSVELAKYARRINNPNAYFVVFVDLEKETNIEQLEAEDLIIALISILVTQLVEKDIRFEKDDFAAIAEEFLSEKEDLSEITKELGIEGETKASVGWSFWKFMGVEANLKGAYARNNKTTQLVRRAIKANSKPLLVKLNNALKGLRSQLEHQQKGKDVLFVIDGLEKANKEVYDSLFVKDVQLIAGIEAQIISTVPIRTYYQIQSAGSRDTFKTSYLPMLRLNKASKALLSEMIFKRVDKSLFGKGVINKLIKMSGGCPRILLKLVNRSIVAAAGETVKPSILNKVLKTEGNERWMALTQKHRDILKSEKFEAADAEVLDLLQSLSILEYNGPKIDRKINPLLVPFVDAMT